MADLNLARQLATGIVEALRAEGHILIAKGKGEALLRELGEYIQPTLVKIMPRVLRSEVHGEVTSTFGDEATDEAVEELVENLRQTLIESEGVEDVFADDNVIDRAIFRTLRSELVHVARTAGDSDEEEKPPISVRLGTLGYVAATAAKLSDQETLQDALERAALSASTELDKFDSATKTAVFTAREDDPEKRLEIEEAVEEELSDLVEMGLVDLPHVTRIIPLPVSVSEAERKALTKSVALAAERTLMSRVCPAAWYWEGDRAIKLVFTPLSEPNEKLVADLATAFAREIPGILAPATAQPAAPAAPPAKAADGAPPPARPSAPGAGPASSRKAAAPPPPPPSKRKAAAAEPPASKKPAAKASAATAKKPAAKATKAAAKPAAKASKAVKAKPVAKAKKAAPKRAAKRAGE